MKLAIATLSFYVRFLSLSKRRLNDEDNNLHYPEFRGYLWRNTAPTDPFICYLSSLAWRATPSLQHRITTYQEAPPSQTIHSSRLAIVRCLLVRRT
ncbi:MAG: hypothetical protein ACE1ZA_06980, partial [Pseudomonadales bacterium]